MSQSTALVIPNEKRYVSRFNQRRADKSLQFGAEKQFLERHCQNNPAIMECDPESVGETLTELAALNLSLNPSMAMAYPIPYWDDKSKTKRLSLNVGYRGMEHIVQRAGTVKSIQAVLVHANDPVFRIWNDEKGRHIEHQEARSGRGEVTHAYCIAHFTNGGYHIEVMDASELMACENAATAKNKKGGYAWKGPFRGEMQKKSVIRRAWKHWPKDDQGIMASAIDAMNRVEPMDFDHEPVEAAPQELTITEEDALSLHANLVDNGLEPSLADKWLARIATIYGLNSIDNLPASALESVQSDLEAYLKQWKENHGAA